MAPTPSLIAQSKEGLPPKRPCISSVLTTGGEAVRSQRTSSRAFSGVTPSINS